MLTVIRIHDYCITINTKKTGIIPSKLMKEADMLSRDGVIARYILAFCFFLLSGAELVTGWPATICGVLGTVELGTALLRYSPLNELIDILHEKVTARLALKNTGE
jgi:hypothetical protein